MANQRDKDKVKVQTWLNKKDKEALEKVIKAKGYTSLSDYLAALAKGAIKLILLSGLVSWLIVGDPVPGLSLAAEVCGYGLYYGGMAALYVAGEVVKALV